MIENQYVVRMAAGLANRMFQYTFYLNLKKKGYDVYVDNHYKASNLKHEDFDWNRIFPNAPIRQASSYLIFKYGGAYTWFDKIRRHWFPITCKTCMMPNATLTPTDEELSKSRYFIGTMQNADIAEFVKKEVMQAFEFTDFQEGTHNYELAQKMLSENSVSIHLRKGEDYMKIEKFQNTCTLDYYNKAVDIIKEKVKNPVFYVFTDNPSWVKGNLKGFEYNLVEGNPAIGWGNHFDMQLMSYCKHNIIANSTYSWWGAFLNKNPNKIVVEPKYWFNPKIESYRTLPNNTICKGWIEI